MAKGDHARAQGSVEYQSKLAQNRLNNNFNTAQGLFNDMSYNYGGATGRNVGDYDNMMQQYKDYLGQNNNVTPGRTGDINSAIGGYKNFADTGGFSGSDIQNIRARAINPTRAVYQNLTDQMGRQRSLQGGYSPNFNAASAKMARDASSAISDANINANASIAQLIQQGKLAGLGGMSSTALQDQGQGLQAQMFNSKLPLEAMQGMTSLYGTSPGLASTFGNQVLNAMGHLNELTGQQNQLGLGTIQNQIASSQIPGNFSQAMGNIGSVLGLGGQIAGMFGGLPTGLTGGVPSGIGLGQTGGLIPGINGPYMSTAGINPAILSSMRS